MELTKVWRGEIGLKLTFWLWGVAIANIALGWILGYMIEATENQFLILLHSLFAIVVNILATVAIWRSAGNYKGSVLWAFLARLSSVANVAILTLALIGVFDASDYIAGSPV